MGFSGLECDVAVLAPVCDSFKFYPLLLAVAAPGLCLCWCKGSVPEYVWDILCSDAVCNEYSKFVGGIRVCQSFPFEVFWVGIEEPYVCVHEEVYATVKFV